MHVNGITMYCWLQEYILNTGVFFDRKLFITSVFHENPLYNIFFEGFPFLRQVGISKVMSELWSLYPLEFMAASLGNEINSFWCIFFSWHCIFILWSDSNHRTLLVWEQNIVWSFKLESCLKVSPATFGFFQGAHERIKNKQSFSLKNATK